MELVAAYLHFREPLAALAFWTWAAEVAAFSCLPQTKVRAARRVEVVAAAASFLPPLSRIQVPLSPLHQGDSLPLGSSNPDSPPGSECCARFEVEGAEAATGVLLASLVHWAVVSRLVGLAIAAEGIERLRRYDESGAEGDVMSLTP